MSFPFVQSFDIEGRDFFNAGKVAAEIKTLLRQLGISGEIIRRAAIASYEAEMNVVMYARRARLTFTMTPEQIAIEIDDEGPGISDIGLAMQEGYSTATDEMREMGFGAGMGLPNIKKNTDQLDVRSIAGKGTKLEFIIRVS